MEILVMQPIKYLANWLVRHANEKHYLFTLKDLRALFPHLSDSAFKTLVSRAAFSDVLTRVCRGIYLYKKSCPSDGLLLFHVAALIRADEFNFISLETILSDAGVISQVPINWISLMSSGRSHVIDCGEFGTIEFVHTNLKPADLLEQLTYDHERKLWKANVALALKNMKRMHRNCDLIDWDIANEFI